MSHSIYVYDPAQTKRADPQSLADFGDILAELQSKRTGPSPKFEQFACHLVATVPMEDGEHSPWLRDLVETARELRGALWNLDLPADDPVRAMRHVVESAQAARLAAYDDQIGMAFLPDGRVVPAERQQEWEDLRDALDDEPQRTTKAGIRKEVGQALATLLSPLTFTPDAALAKADQADLEFSRQIEGGRQRIRLYVEGASPTFRSAIHAIGDLDVITDMYRMLLPDVAPERRYAFLFELRNLIPDFEQSRLWLQPKARLDKTMDAVVVHALPALERARDLAGVDWLMNGDDSPLRTYMKRWRTASALAVAFYARNPRFDALAAELVASSADRVDGTPAQLQTLLAHFRGRAGPL
jgi:hypothetical protein